MTPKRRFQNNVLISSHLLLIHPLSAHPPLDPMHFPAAQCHDFSHEDMPDVVDSVNLF